MRLLAATCLCLAALAVPADAHAWPIVLEGEYCVSIVPCAPLTLTLHRNRHRMSAHLEVLAVPFDVHGHWRYDPVAQTLAISSGDYLGDASRVGDCFTGTGVWPLPVFGQQPVTWSVCITP